MQENQGIDYAMQADEFTYGRRQIITYNRTAQPSYSYEPLTQADFLDPQPTDEFSHGPQHAADVALLLGIFRQHYRGNPVVTLLSNVKMIWDVAELAQPAPDLAVVIGLESLEHELTQFDVQGLGQRPRTIVEVVSPHFAQADLVEKLQIYAQGGVTEYFVIDSGERTDNSALHYQVLGYRLVKQSYEPIAPDADGRVYSKVNRLWLLPTADGASFTAISERTGQPIIPDADSLSNVTAARVEATFRATAIASQLNFLREDGPE